MCGKRSCITTIAIVAPPEASVGTAFAPRSRLPGSRARLSLAIGPQAQRYYHVGPAGHEMFATAESTIFPMVASRKTVVFYYVGDRARCRRSIGVASAPSSHLRRVGFDLISRCIPVSALQRPHLWAWPGCHAFADPSRGQSIANSHRESMTKRRNERSRPFGWHLGRGCLPCFRGESLAHCDPARDPRKHGTPGDGVSYRVDDARRRRWLRVKRSLHIGMHS